MFVMDLSILGACSIAMLARQFFLFDFVSGARQLVTSYVFVSYVRVIFVLCDIGLAV